MEKAKNKKASVSKSSASIDNAAKVLKSYEQHSDVPKKYRWDLSFLLNGMSVEEAFKDTFSKLREQLALRDTKYDSSQNYLRSLRAYDEASRKINRLNNYLGNSFSLNVVDNKMLELQDRFRNELVKFEVEYGPDTSRFFENAAKIAKWAKLPEFKDYKYLLEHRLEEKNHILPKQIEEYRQQMAIAEPDFNTIFDVLSSSELDKGEAIDSKGNRTKITNANYSFLLESDDESVRKSAYLAREAAYNRMRETLSQLVFQHKRVESADARVKKFNSTVEMLMFPDRTDEKFLKSLYMATQKSVPVLRDFFENWKKFYKLNFGSEPQDWDFNRKFFESKREVSLEQGINEFLGSIEPYGKEYVQVVKKGLDQNWVDFLPVKSKRGGAYSIGGSYAIDKKLILMNWDFTARSTETLAHEFGHSLHSYFVEKSNAQVNAHTRIFLAEIASILNELLLMDYWLKNATSDKDKFEVLSRFIIGFSGTVFRQIWFSNYEYDFYKLIDSGQAANNYSVLSKLYYDNHLRYSGNVKKDAKKEEMYTAVTVPHFYYGFYVHKYAIGQLVACIFFQRYKEQGSKALQDYIKTFLSVGSDRDPIDVLKLSGIDLHDPKAYDLGFKTFAENTKEWIRLGNLIWKSGGSNTKPTSKGRIKR